MTKTEICNHALLLLSSGRIESFDDDEGEIAQDCRTLYSPSKAAVLESLDWEFARKRARLPSLSDAPAFGFSYQHQLPADCISVVRATSDDWEREGRLLLSDSSEQYIVYTADVPEGEFSGMFSQALGAYLAIHMGYKRTESTGKVDRAVRLYDFLITKAQGNTNRARVKRTDTTGSLSRARTVGR